MVDGVGGQARQSPTTSVGESSLRTVSTLDIASGHRSSFWMALAWFPSVRWFQRRAVVHWWSQGRFLASSARPSLRHLLAAPRRSLARRCQAKTSRSRAAQTAEPTIPKLTRPVTPLAPERQPALWTAECPGQERDGPRQQPAPEAHASAYLSRIKLRRLVSIPAKEFRCDQPASLST